MTPAGHAVPPPADEFQSAVGRLCEAIDQGGPGFVRADLLLIIRNLESTLRSRARSASVDIVGEIICESLAAFVGARRNGHVDPRRNPAGYLVTIAQHKAVDRCRKQNRETPTPPETLPDDPDASDDVVARMFDDEANAGSLAAALQEAVRRRDLTVTAVVATWLDLAADLGRAPSSREVAAVVGIKISHTGVQKALDRFGKWIPRGDATP